MLIAARFQPSRYTEKKMTRLVREMGTGPMESENGASTQVTAVIRAVSVRAWMRPRRPVPGAESCMGKAPFL